MPTTIQVTQKTVERLKYFKNHTKESYDEIINKILNIVEEGELTDDAIRDIQSSLEEMKAGKGETIEDVAKEFGVNL